MKKTVTGTVISVLGPRQNPQNQETELTIEIKGHENYSHLIEKQIQITIDETTPGERLFDIFRERYPGTGLWHQASEIQRVKYEQIATRLVEEGWTIRET